MLPLIALLSMAAAPAQDPVVGTWEGTSLCQVRPSPCHDEQAVYHVKAEAPGSYRFVMGKRVNGRDVIMGETIMRRGPAGQLSGTTYDRAGQPARWTFEVHGARMSGRLVTSGGRLFRLIDLGKQ